MTSNGHSPTVGRLRRGPRAGPPFLSRRSLLTGTGALALTLAACSDDEDVPVRFPPPPRTRPLEQGVFLPGGPLDSTAVRTYTAMIGAAPQWFLTFRDWTVEVPPLTALDAALALGATPVLTWEPWYAPPAGTFPSDAARQPPFALARLLAGDHDYRIDTWADGLAKWGDDVVLRFAHEMNGDWYPWGARVQGNTPEQYVEAWHYVHEKFRSAGADNVRWCWAPNVPVPGTEEPVGTELERFFPGDDVVDLLGIDGYNWGSASPALSWTSPADLFGPGLQQLRALRSGLPIVVTETASAEGEELGRKAAWIARLFEFLGDQGDVRAVIWFQEDKENDWRVNSSPSALAAYRRAVDQLE